jgi:predicted amidohydrolase
MVTRVFRGEILAEAGEGEEIIWGELDIKSVEEMRRNIPSLRQKRTDIYTLPTLL